jgi:hypothetical protein
MIFRNFLFFIFGLISCNSQGIVITQYPPSKVNIDSSQVISWKSPVKLDSVSIDLYQRKQFKQNLGKTNQNLNNFKWDVSRNCDLGDEYYIKITGKSHINGTAWVNTPNFSIVLDGMTSGTISIITVVGVIVLLLSCVCACSKTNKRKSILGDLNSPLAHQGIPVGQPTATTYPPNIVHHQPAAATYPPTVILQPQRQSYSRGSVAGAAVGGIVTGIVVDEVIHRGGHRHHHHTNHDYDFGGGRFFGEDNSRGDASDSSWGFFSDTDSNSGGGGGDNSGGFY